MLIAVGAGIVVVVIFGATLAVCCRRRSNKGVLNTCECAQTVQEIYSYTAVFTLAGQGESEAGITVYEEVNTDGPAKVSASICLLFKVHVILQKDF